MPVRFGEVPLPELLLESDGVPVLRCPLHGQSLSVGRSPANDVSLPDQNLPPLLCSFEPDGPGGRYTVVDRSGTGLQINDNKVQDRLLEDGDTLAFGRLSAKFVKQSLKERVQPQGAGQRTGILTRKDDGTLERTDLVLQLPESLGSAKVGIGDGGLRIGAGADNDVVIDDGFVSTFHAQLFWRGDRLFIRDLDSTNGTLVDDVRVVEAEIKAGSNLLLGEARISVVAKVSREKVAPPKGAGPWHCGKMVTVDAGFAKAFQMIEKVARHDATVCIFGETGCGKDLVAQALHNLSGREKAPIVPLNCAAIPESLIESVLFGHEKGAFTGADRQRKGAFEEAHRGTIFLDEIGELPLDMQAKLLRVLETRQVRRVGGAGDIDVDVRVVAATHRDLMERVREKKFREDLLHRLYVIPIFLPALRERPADIAYLARHFADLLSPPGREVQLTDAAAAKLKTHPFPGNVRELRNVIQRALILGDGQTVDANDIEFIPVTLEEATTAAATYKPGMTLEDVERETFRSALECYKTAAEAARHLGLPKTTFWRRATALGVLTKKK